MIASDFGNSSILSKQAKKFRCQHGHMMRLVGKFRKAKIPKERANDGRCKGRYPIARSSGSRYVEYREYRGTEGGVVALKRDNPLLPFDRRPDTFISIPVSTAPRPAPSLVRRDRALNILESNA
jgi:hypothetical protein